MVTKNYYYNNKVCDGAVALAFQADLLARAATLTDRARLHLACADHSGDELYAPRITAVGMRLNDEMILISVGTRIGARTCEPHTCPCGKTVDARRLHGLSFAEKVQPNIRDIPI